MPGGRGFLSVTIALFSIWPSISLAQDASSTARLQNPATAPIAGWQDGFFLQSTDEQYRLVFGMVAQADGRFALGEPKPIVNTFLIRKVRPTFTGRITKYFEFKVMPDFGNNTTIVQDAYVDLRLTPSFRIRSGKDKTPVGYELLQGDAFLWFPERSQASNLVPNRDTGVQVQGDVLSGRVAYSGGVFNGIPDGTSSTTDDSNNAKDLAGRILIQPFRTTSGTFRPLNNLGFHVGASTGQETATLPSFRTSIGQTYFTYAAGAAADGKRTRVSPAVFYYYKSFGAFAEYMRSSQEVSAGDVHQTVTNEGWDVTASIMLTGEAVSYGAIRPRNNLDPPNRHGGALQLLARYAVLSVDDAVFANGLAAATASAGAHSFTIAVNWYPNGFIKYYATFERTVFGATATSARQPENAILFRTQLGF